MKNLIFILTILSIISCKKEHTCQCINPGGTVAVFIVKDTKKKASKKCKDYYNQNYASVPFNETSCEIK